ncbi:hypothetical protein ACHAWU_000990 [Discostella pseudostelligera]|uniref:SCP domain-containing protein n=1 Tax=Discostella pseudostelligera TaxID=259834 RepID=A0ABD3MFZ8_9STRA
MSAMQDIDLEGVPPPEIEEEQQPSPAASSERPTTTSFSRRKRTTVAAAVSVLLVVAITVGAILSGKPNQSVPAAGSVSYTKQKAESASAADASAADENLAEFNGPLTDFIVTNDLSRISVTRSDECTKPNEGLWFMQFDTDKYPWENSWTLKDAQGKVVMSGPPQGRNYDRLTKYVGSMCVAAGKYTVTLNDKGKDGVCCEYGPGAMVVKVNGKTVASTGDSNFDKFERTITVAAATNGGGSAPTPTPPPTQSSGSTGKKYAVIVKMLTDDYGKETGYKFESVKDGSVLLNKPQGSMTANTPYKDTFNLAAGQYRLTVQDELMGIQPPGYYEVVMENEIALHDSKAKSYIIDVGYNPSMTTNEENWLTQHNTRRQTYHEAEGVTYRPLVWSPILAKAASDWVDVLLSNSTSCTSMYEKGIDEGENVSARTVSSQQTTNEGPAKILTRWSDNQANKSWPDNASRTQVLWRATRYLGCASKVSTFADGTRCYASVCRYSRPGNCAMTSNDWEAKVLADESKCGYECPNDVCY